MRTFINSRAMALTLGLEAIDDADQAPAAPPAASGTAYPRQERRRPRRPVSPQSQGQSSAGGSPATSRAQAACSRRAQRSGTRPVRIPVIACGSLAAM